MEIALPPLVSASGFERDEVRVPESLLHAAAVEFVRGLVTATGDAGVWSRTDEKPNTIMMGVLAAHLPVAVPWLARHRFVHWVAPLPMVTTLNKGLNEVIQGFRPASGPSPTPFWDVGLAGEGQLVGVGDSGAERKTCYLSGKDKFAMYRGRDEKDATGHGTHVVATIVGSKAGGDDYDGVAKHARVAFSDHGIGDNFYHHGTMGYGYQFAYDLGARIHSDSWGTDGDNHYSKSSHEVDEFAFQNNRFLPLFAAGNAHSYKSLSSPATSKNSLAIGATLSPSSESRIALEIHDHGMPWEIDIGGPDAAHWVHAGIIGADSHHPHNELTSVIDSRVPQTAMMYAMPRDGCSELTNQGDVAGKIILILGGACVYSQKAENAKAAGAVAVVMISDQRGLGFSRMDGDPDRTVDIPILLVPTKDGELLVALSEQRPGTTIGFTKRKELSPYLWEHIAEFSSAGPLESGRMGVDLVAPGDSIYSSSSNLNTGYCSVDRKSGTFMSTPFCSRGRDACSAVFCRRVLPHRRQNSR